MFQVLSRSWALLIGMMLLMVGNGLQGTLLGRAGRDRRIFHLRDVHCDGSLFRGVSGRFTLGP